MNQALVVLDVAQVTDGEFLHLLPPVHRKRVVLRLSTVCGHTPAGPGAMTGPYDWDVLCRGVDSLAEKARSAIAAGAALFVAGRAPLPLFVQLGYELNKFSGEAWVLNSYMGGPWEIYRADAQPPLPGATPFFDALSGLPGTPSGATGVVSVFVSCGKETPVKDILEVLKRIHQPNAGTVAIRTAGPRAITDANIGQVADEIAQHMSQIPGKFPHASGMALFVDGPTQLAFVIGRALNVHIQGDIWVMNYDKSRPGPSHGYEAAVKLPFLAEAPVVSSSAGDEQARREIWLEMCTAIRDLAYTLDASDFPAVALAKPDAHLRRLKALSLQEEPTNDDPFSLSIAPLEMTVGRRLLEAIRRANPETQARRFAQLLVLHELFHDGQQLRTSNFAGIGRAGVALEEIDFWADAFALRTLIAWDLRQNATAAMATTTSWIDTAIWGIEAFDRFEQGEHIKRLYERRLRRYLIWHLQRARARTVQKLEDVSDLFGDRLIVELAPLDVKLDARGDKLVSKGLLGETEIFAVLRGYLVRHGPRPGFEPSELVAAVQSFDHDLIRRAMHVLVQEHPAVLVPWTER